MSDCPDRVNADLRRYEFEQQEMERKNAASEKEADEMISYGDFSVNDIIEAIKNAQPNERRGLCNYIGSDNCSAGIELHRLVREELIRKLGR